MEIKSAKDIIEKRNALLYRLKDLYDCLNNTSKNPFKDKKEKEAIQKEIKNINDKLSGLEIIVKEGSNFKSDEFCIFVNDLLKLGYNDLKISKKEIHSYDNTNSKIVYFISNNLTKEAFINYIDNDKELNEFRENNNSTIVIDTNYIKPFNNNLLMKEEYRKYTPIKNAIYELIDLYIKEPELSDTERLNKVLKNTIKRNINRSNNGQSIK